MPKLVKIGCRSSENTQKWDGYDFNTVSQEKLQAMNRFKPVDWERDLPSKRKPKRIIFYPDGLKIYGLLPYLLQRQLRGEFSSAWIKLNNDEDNFTVISYQQKPEHVQKLVDWLYEAAGFEWTIALGGERLRSSPGETPITYKPPESFQHVIAKAFQVAVETQNLSAPKPWDVVLAHLQPYTHSIPTNTDVVLGGFHEG